jgi:hypothetical protein
MASEVKGGKKSTTTAQPQTDQERQSKRQAENEIANANPRSPLGVSIQNARGALVKHDTKVRLLRFKERYASGSTLIQQRRNAQAAGEI